MVDDRSIDDATLLNAKITLETAKMPWRDLQRLFAAGRVVAVDPTLDLVAVAAALSRDDKACFQRWLDNEAVQPVTDATAQRWFEQDTMLWTVVVAPWVLVQEA